MEVKVPKEIRDYQESIFFGLSTRQFLCSLLAVGVAVGHLFLDCARWWAARKWAGSASSEPRPSPPADFSNTTG